MILQRARLFNVIALVYNYAGLNFVELLFNLGLAIADSVYLLTLLTDSFSMLENFDAILDTLLDKPLLSYMLVGHNRDPFFFQVTLIFWHVLNFLLESLIVFLFDQSYFFGLLTGFVDLFEHFGFNLLQLAYSVYYHHCIAV